MLVGRGVNHSPREEPRGSAINQVELLDAISRHVHTCAGFDKLSVVADEHQHASIFTK